MARKPQEFEKHPMSYVEARDRGLTRAVCEYIVDGDTADFLVDLGWMQFAYVSVRFYDIDTAEMRGTSGIERDYANRAKQQVETWLLHKPVLLKSYKDVVTFDRFVADVWFQTDDLNLVGLPSAFRVNATDTAMWVPVAEALKYKKLTKADARAAAGGGA